MFPFRTLLPPWRAPFELTHADRLLLAGSCFTEHLGERLADHKFVLHNNPFGIVYNPVSIGQCLDRLLRGGAFFSENELFEYEGLWHSWEHHGRFSHPDRGVALGDINTAYRDAAAFLPGASCLMLTLGTAHVSLLRADGRVVANNHKAPAAWFEARRLSVGEVCDALGPVLAALQGRCPGLRIVLTVSPVRHLRLGAVENQRSKAVLLLACEELCRQLPGVCYFPAYELLLDDLRDYRFYTADMVHPNDTAVEYIWEYFSQAFFSPATRELNRQIGKIVTAARHRPLHPGRPQQRAFAEGQLDAIQRVLEVHPELDFSAEIAHFRSQTKTSFD